MTTLVLCLISVGIAAVAVGLGELAGKWMSAPIARIIELAAALILYTLAAGLVK